MKWFVGTIKRDGENVLMDIDLWIEDTGREWYGGFELPRNKIPTTQEIWDSGRDVYYHLFLDDGRSGKMFINRVKVGETLSVEFRGTGPLV